ncbi:hypothetical protein JQ596_01470 [Bradyrhizobium manausense]|uniref:hypothetical protein n=1 Tax=Bradyrhizobium TaxID=374 RepID=UPI001BA52ACF|nr:MULTISPECIES: hypothetical protein [Bradyrhizobium]MBR0824187.1 hypothetical protein [Bradyrhizobium manausense]UVO26591.1 hypothetical protein KUF59_29075 [Bradyrhizobium arachidis]
MSLTSGRAALILLTGLFVALGGSLQAAPATPASTQQDSAGKSTDAVRYTKHRRHYARTRTSKSAQKSDDDKAGKTDKKDAPITAANDAIPASSTMPASIANANAQLAAADTPLAASATAMTAQANDNVQAAAADKAAGQPVASDQLSETDRALLQDNPPAQKTVVAAVEAQPRPAPVMASASSESSTWDQTSLIGKIFIGFGALLTLASAARMFMA